MHGPVKAFNGKTTVIQKIKLFLNKKKKKIPEKSYLMASSYIPH